MIKRLRDKRRILSASSSPTRLSRLLNLPVVCDLLRRFGMPEHPCGAAQLRWARVSPLPTTTSKPPFGVLVYLRQAVKSDPNTGWAEHCTALKCYLTAPGNEPLEVDRPDKGLLLEGLFKAVVKTKPEDRLDLVSELLAHHSVLLPRLQRPTDEELGAGIRYGITPLFCAIKSLRDLLNIPGAP